MIVYPVNTKDLVIPSGLGVAEPTSVAVSGITEEECQEMIDESLEGYYTSGQTDEKLQDYATTADTADLQRQIDDISGMTPEDVQQIVDDSLVDYATTAVTSDLQDQINALTGQTGTEVEWNQIETGGTKIAEITIDGQKTDVYAPQGGQGGVTPEQVQQQIDSALTGYYTSGQTDTLLEGYATTADTESISESASSAYDAVYYEDESGETRNQIDELWEQKQDTLVEGDGIDLSDDPEIKVKLGYNQGLYFKSDGGLAVLPGSGITLSDGAVVANIGQGLEFSGNTLVVDTDVIATTADTAALETAISGKSSVSVTQSLSAGTQIAQITVDGTDTTIYAPAGGGGAQYQAGSGITISGNTISKTRTDYDYTALKAMTDQQRSVIFTEMLTKYNNNEDVYLKVPTSSESDIYLPLVEHYLNTTAAAPASRGDRLYFSTALGEGRCGISILSGGTWGNRYGFAGNGNSAISTGAEYLPKATASVLGGVMVKSGLTVNSSGHLSVSPATTSEIGGVIVGDGLAITTGGTLSAKYPGYEWVDMDDYENNWSSTQREDWYDRVFADFYSGNTKYGAYIVKERGYDDNSGNPYAEYYVATIHHIEAGFQSLHFFAYDVDGSTIKIRDYRVYRGAGSFDMIGEWTNYSGGQNSQYTDRTGWNVYEQGFVYELNTGLTAYNWDSEDYDRFARSLGGVSTMSDYYTAAFQYPMRIIDDNGGVACEFNVHCVTDVTSEYSGTLNPDSARRVYFQYFLNGDLYHAVIDVIHGDGVDQIQVKMNTRLYGMWSGTAQQYNAVNPKSSNVLYFVDR